MKSTYKPRTAWASEALSWVKTSYEITGSGGGASNNNDSSGKEDDTIDDGLKGKGESGRKAGRRGCDQDGSTNNHDGGCLTTDVLRFSTFASCCLQNERGRTAPRPQNKLGKQMLFLSDSARDRIPVLCHIFRPLMGDIFVFKTTNSVFDKMGIVNDTDVLLRYFGEWFGRLSPLDAERSGLIGKWCPVVRWLQDIIMHHFEVDHNGGSHLDKDTYDSTPLMALIQFCENADDLPRAFVLAAIMWEAVSVITMQLEEKTYGKIKQKDCGK